MQLARPLLTDPFSSHVCRKQFAVGLLWKSVDLFWTICPTSFHQILSPEMSKEFTPGPSLNDNVVEGIGADDDEDGVSVTY